MIKKKMICKLCIMAIIIAFPVVCIADGCSTHHRRYQVSDEPDYLNYLYLSNTAHQYTERKYYHCQACEALGYLSTWADDYTRTDNHLSSGSWNGEHLIGTTLHTLNHYCNKCHHDWVFYYYCPGNPCIYYNSINPTE